MDSGKEIESLNKLDSKVDELAPNLKPETVAEIKRAIKDKIAELQNKPFPSPMIDI